MTKRIESGTYARGIGLSYLSWIKRMAIRFRITGVASVIEDGTIKVVAEGEEEDLARFANKLEKGKLFTLMESFWVKWEDPIGEFSDFSIA